MVGKFAVRAALAGVAMVVVASSAAAQKKDRYLILAEEIATRQEIANAHDAVRMLRSQWLRPVRAKGGLGAASFGSGSSRPAGGKSTGSEDNPTSSPDAASQAASASREKMLEDETLKKTEPVVYIDDVKQQELEDLRSVRRDEIAEIRFINGNDASGRYGAGHEAGAILVKTNRLKH